MAAAMAYAATPEAPAGEALLMEALLGGGLPAAAERHLRRAAASYDRDDEAEGHLRLAQGSAPDHAAVLIGFYRFYFYKGRLREALSIARICQAKAARDNDLPQDWRQVRPWQAGFGRWEAMLPRFYLFTLKAFAYLQLRLGQVEDGHAAVLKLLELDPTDKVGARVLLGVLDRQGQDDDD